VSVTLTEVHEVLLLDERQEFTLAEFMELTGLCIGDLQHLIDSEALQPLPPIGHATDVDAAHLRFSGEFLGLARAAFRLRRDFDLDANGLALALRLLNRIRELESELLRLRAQWPHSAE